MERYRRAEQQYAGGVPTDPFQSQVDSYLDNLRGGMTYTIKMLETMFYHMNVVRPPTMPP